MDATSTPPANREATSSIRGYLYQFDATIFSILNASDNAVIKVEGIEDFDISYGQCITANQCKYYESQELNNSTLRDVMLPMLEDFSRRSTTNQKLINYTLYGHFKNSSSIITHASIENIKTILTRKTRVDDAAERSFKTVEIWNERGYHDEFLGRFCKSFKIVIASEFYEHRKNIIKKISETFNCSEIESEHYYYPTCVKIVSDLAIAKKSSGREIRREHFLEQLRPQKALFSVWQSRELSREKYCKMMRQKYFSSLNNEISQRFFIIEGVHSEDVRDIVNITHHIKNKWSTHELARKPDKERCAPFVYFRDFSSEMMDSLLSTLYIQGVSFTDGYPFRGSPFTIEHLFRPQTRDNRLSLRLIYSNAELDSALASVRSELSIFQFFRRHVLNLSCAGQHIAIPIHDSSMIKEIA
jgi:hypothetical protein